MSLLHNLKEWFLKRSKLEVKSTALEITSLPSYEKVKEEPLEPELRFYTEKYKIDSADKKQLSSLIQKEEFRVFEKYLDWRVNASAHRMKAFLMERKDNLAANEAAAIDALVKITQDMQNFWTEVKLMDADKELVLKRTKKSKPKAFGEDAVSLDFLNEQLDEIIRV